MQLILILFADPSNNVIGVQSLDVTVSGNACLLCATLHIRDCISFPIHFHWIYFKKRKEEKSPTTVWERGVVSSSRSKTAESTLLQELCR